MNLTLADYIAWVENKTLNPRDVVLHYLNKAKNNDQYNAFISVPEQYIHDNLDDYSAKVLRAAPIAIKDIILVKWSKTTCGSDMLRNYDSPYTATCIEKLHSHGGIMIGKTNMDEAAMGASTETSAFWKCFNPHGTNRIPGGSSGWSAAAVAGDLALAALGTDTGGSIRQPAALCGVVGLKPTYGRVSRYGVSAMASSLDQVGTFTKNVSDAALLLWSVAGYDDKDAQTQPRDEEMIIRSEECKKTDLKGIKIAVPKEFYAEWLDPKIAQKLDEMIQKLQEKGAIVEEVSMPTLPYAVATYYAIQPAEASTNLARFDGLKFWLQDDTFTYDNIKDYYKAIRSKGFGKEVQRRILLGTYALSAANYEGIYMKAWEVREKMKDDFSKTFKDYDVILGPTTPTVAWKMGEEPKDPLAMYMADIFVCPANLTGVPAMSIPAGTVENEGEQMPVWLQIMANHRREDLLFHVGKVMESVV